ncbi:hypothetical protein GX48_02031 [Paracoccidioides brasiliensis]|nr:hypothetical protein GX48_02031 [Paracoccidioides brasiliensis]
MSLLAANLATETLCRASSPSINVEMLPPSINTGHAESDGSSHADQGKRKPKDAFEPLSPKRPKLIGPFIDEDDSESEDDGNPFASRGPKPGLQDEVSNSASSNTALNTSPPSPNTRTPSVLSSISENGNANQTPSTNSTESSFETLENAKPSKKSLFTPLVHHNSQKLAKSYYSIQTCSDRIVNVQTREVASSIPYEQIIAERSTTVPGRAQKSYYGIDIHRLLDDITVEDAQDLACRSRLPSHQASTETSSANKTIKGSTLMWTEKYRARKFKDLVGDERTHRSVLRWLKSWDAIVFPGLAKLKPKNTTGNDAGERTHRKVLVLTGPPGLGKTTLAHVCARQAGYEVLEINASDERSRDIVKGRIRDAVGTENVKGITVEADGKRIRKAGKPVCVVVDEVDGVVGGSGGSGEGGFMKALIDLVMLDRKNSHSTSESTSIHKRRYKKGDKFLLLRPLILICNDVYHPSLRPLRTSSIAEILHVRQASLDKVVLRMKTVFEREGIPCDGDGVRRLCEASWGLSSSRDRNTNNRGIGEGDIRRVLVAGEWIAQKLRATSPTSDIRLTRRWVEQHISIDSVRDGGSSRALGRGGTKDIVERVFLDGAGFPDVPISAQTFQDPFSGGNVKIPVGISNFRKRHAITRLREMVDAAGEYDRYITDCFTAYPTQAYQDDTILSKPNAAYEWLHFHDMISSKVYTNQDWELNPYLSQSVVAFHHLFASSNRRPGDGDKNLVNIEEDGEEHPLSGPRADFAAFEAQKHNHATITEFQSRFSPALLRTFRSTESIITELIPNLTRMLAPGIKPVIVGGSGGQRSVASVRKESERALVSLSVRVMSGIGVKFEHARIESETGFHNGWIYRMEPPLDTLTTFSNLKGVGSSAPVRYAVRQVLQQEYEKDILRQRSKAGQARMTGPKGGNQSHEDYNYPKENGPSGVASSILAARLNGPKLDFFGRVIANEAQPNSIGPSNGVPTKPPAPAEHEQAWVSFHEGFSNAVRKQVTLSEFLSGL